MTRSVPQSVLSLLLAGPMPPEVLRELGQRHGGKRHAVNVAIERLRAAGLIEVQARLTERGLKAARKGTP